MKKLLTSFVFIVLGNAVFATDLLPKEFGDIVLFEGEVVSSKYLHDGLDLETAIHELLIRFEKKFYHCRVSDDYRECYDFGKQYWLHD